MSDEFAETTDMFATIKEAGYDPDIVIPLFDLIAESAVMGVRGHRDGDATIATIAYGRVAGIFDALLVLGLPVPADSPADIMNQADHLLPDDGLAEGLSDEAAGRVVPFEEEVSDE